MVEGARAISLSSEGWNQVAIRGRLIDRLQFCEGFTRAYAKVELQTSGKMSVPEGVICWRERCFWVTQVKFCP
jgi:hypothetical protein